MVRRLGSAAVIIWLATILQVPAQGVPPLADMRAKVNAFVSKAYPAADARRVSVEYADINSDGMPEAFVIVADLTSCGPDPCAVVLDLSAERASQIAILAGSELTALQTKRGKWRDIMIDGKRLRWQNGAYQ